jgi:hypothetical protein
VARRRELSSGAMPLNSTRPLAVSTSIFSAPGLGQDASSGPGRAVPAMRRA